MSAAAERKTRRRRTRSSAFGAPGRISHDARRFYGSRRYATPQPTAGEGEDHPLPPKLRDRLFLKSSEDMSELPDNSVQLMVTSPPYNAGKEYDLDLSLEDYLALLERVMRETYRVLSSGGRACVNVANLGRKPYIPLHAYLIQVMHSLGYQMRGEIIWNKASSAGPSTAWGSWRSATNPVLRDVHEYILVFSKGSFTRDGRGRKNSIGRDEFLAWTKSVWAMPTVSARQVGHPAPFPEELPRRLIELFTFVGDSVLDPFCGSGTTCLAARALSRHYVGYDNHPEYLYLAQERLARQT